MDPYLRKILIYLEKYNIPDDHRDVFFKLSKITEHIYVSNLKEAVNIPYVQEEQISSILYLGDTPKSKPTMMKYKELNIEHKFIQIQDSNTADITSVFDECYDFIANAVDTSCRVLIHCSQGVSRSSTIAILYYLRRFYGLREHASEKKYLFTILQFVKSKRPCAEPNSNFIHQLIREETRLQKNV